MDTTTMAAIAVAYRQTHERILTLVAGLGDDQLTWRPAAGGHSIAWNLWHLARWADALQEALPRMTPALQDRLGAREQVWLAERRAARWGLSCAPLGVDATGTYMEDAQAAALVWPAKEVLLAYVRRAVAAADEAVRAVDEPQAGELDATQGDFTAAYYGPAAGAGPATATVASAILEHLVHENRHLGEMEGLCGQQGQRGSATV